MCIVKSQPLQLHRSKLIHPCDIFLQVTSGDGLRAFLESSVEVFVGGGQFQLLLGQVLDLIRTLALNESTHGHHGSISVSGVDKVMSTYM